MATGCEYPLLVLFLTHGAICVLVFFPVHFTCQLDLLYYVDSQIITAK